MNDENEDNVTSIITADEFLKIGLKLVGYTKRRIRRCKKKTNVERFVAHFGSIPCVCACIWEDLQTTEVEEAQVPVNDLNVEYFLMAMHHLKRYVTESEREAIFDISKKWGREKVWFYMRRFGSTSRKCKPSRHKRLFGQPTISETTFGVLL